MTTKQRVGHAPTHSDGRQLNCACGTDPKNGYWVWCPLHAAAPELLDALKHYAEVCGDGEGLIARQAIAKATGESH